MWEWRSGLAHIRMPAVQNTKLPMPHLEQPKLAEEKTYRVSFLEEQTVQSNATIFTTQLSYTFDTWDGGKPESTSAVVLC